MKRESFYHAHIYFDEKTVGTVETFVRLAEETGWFSIGRIHKKLVGPHPSWSCGLVFKKNDLDNVKKWIDAHREGLSVLIHPVTNDDVEDHTTSAKWLGRPMELIIESLR